MPPDTSESRERNRDIHRDIKWDDHGPDVRVLQENLRDLAHAFDGVFNNAPQADGIAGKHTMASARRAAYILGLPQATLDDIARGPGARDNVIRTSVQRQIRHPDERTDAQKKLSQKRRAEIRHHHQQAQQQGLIVTFDGLNVPGWIARDALIPARKDGVHFTVISGVRDPDYSEHLCYVMCGHPTCPGQCAGKSSNHACPPSFKCSDGEGAVDVSPGALELRHWCESHNVKLIGGGAVLGSADVNHFSRSGR